MDFRKLLPSNMTLLQKGLLLIAIPLLFEIGFVTTVALLLDQAHAAARREAHSREVVAEANRLTNSSWELIGSLFGYGLFRGDLYLQSYDYAKGQFQSAEAALMRLTEGNYRQHQFAATLMKVGGKMIVMVDEARTAMTQSAKVTSFQELIKGHRSFELTLAQLFSANTELVHEVQRTSPSPSDLERNTLVINAFLITGIGANVLLAVVLMLIFVKGTRERVNTVIENITRFGHRQSLAPKVSGSDEIAVLDSGFHDMAERLVAAEAQRARDDAFKAEVLSMVSHDLRSPLMSIQVALHLLSAGVLGDLSEDAADTVYGAELDTFRLITLINDLLAMDSLDAGKLRLATAKVSVSRLFERALNAVSNLMKTKKLRSSVVDSGLDAYCDEERVVQVMTNLLANAIKYSPEGGTIELFAEEYNRILRINITDQGSGIPEEFHQTVFEPFQQLDPRHGGSGLGLTICKRLVDEHGGQIGVTSGSPSGSRFWFTLPFEELSTEEIQAAL